VSSLVRAFFTFFSFPPRGSVKCFRNMYGRSFVFPYLCLCPTERMVNKLTILKLMRDAGDARSKTVTRGLRTD